MPNVNSGISPSLFPPQWSSLLLPASSIKGAQIIETARREIREGAVVFPSIENIFRALHLTTPSSVKVVIIGQDVYHEKGQANGLAFSVNEGVKLPPSLRNIFQELHSDLGISPSSSGDLTSWAEQGVLLLNTVLTVYEGRANSCVSWGWQEITGDIVRACFSLPQPVVFIAWGRQARLFIDNIKSKIQVADDKVCIYSSHPSPLGAYKSSAGVPAFFGSKPFSTANKLLTELGSLPIDWRLKNTDG